MRTICYEIKKLTAGKPFIFATLLLLAYFVFMMFCDLDSNMNTIQSVDKELSAGLTEERIEECKAEYADMAATKIGIMTEEEAARFSTLGIIIDQDSYRSNYKEHMSSLAAELHEKAKGAAASGNAYEMNYYKAAQDTYNTVRDISMINSAGAACLFARFHGVIAIDGVNFNEMISLRWGYVLIIWAVLISAWLLCCEREYKTEYIVFSSYHGKSREFLCKLSALALMVFMVIFVTTVTEIIYAVVVYKVDIFASIQSYSEFELCPLGINILAMILLMQLMMYVAVMFAVLLTALFSIKAATPVRGIILGIIFTVAAHTLIAIYWNISSHEQAEQFNIIRMLFPPELIHQRDYLMSFDVAPLFGVPVPRFAVTIALTLLFIIAAAAVCAVFYGRSAEIRWKAKLLSLIKSRKATEV